MDAHRQAREYLARHGIEQWLRAATTRLVVTQPENPLRALYEALGREMEMREELNDVGREEGSASLVARIVVRGRGGVRQEISLDKIANEDMSRGARGGTTMRGWANELGSRVAEALVGHGGGGSVAVGESGRGGARDPAAELADLVAGLASDLAGLAADMAVAGGGGQESEGAAQEVDDDDDNGGTGSWALPEETRARLEELFGKIDKNDNGVLDTEEREVMKEEMRMLLIEFGMGGDVFDRLPAGVDFAEFEAWFVREWETSSKMQALAGIDIDLLRAAAKLLPGGSPRFPLGGMVGMGPADIERGCREKVAAAAQEALARKQAQVREQAERMGARGKEEGVLDGGGVANGKYVILGEGIRKAEFGSIEDFHMGIGGEIGMPNPNFMEGMEAEHCKRQDSKDEFKPGNYDMTTTPSQECRV